MDNDTRTGDTRTGLGTAATEIGPDLDAHQLDGPRTDWGFTKDADGTS